MLVFTMELSLQLLLVFCATFLLTYSFFRQRRGTDGRKLPPSLWSLPIVGSLPFLPTDLKKQCQFLIAKSNLLGKVFTMYGGSRLIVVLNSRESMKSALVKHSVDFADRNELYTEHLTNPNNKGIVFHRYNGEFRKYHRLSLSIMREFGYGKRVMETRILTEVQQMIDNFRAEQGFPFDPKRTTISCVANVIASIVFGRRFDQSDENFQNLITDGKYIIDNLCVELAFFRVLRFLPYYRRIGRLMIAAVQRINNFIDHNITACCNTSTTSDAKTESFVNSFIQAEGENFDREQLIYTARDLFAAGTDTSAITFLWAVVLLANYPSVQERIQDGIDSVVGRDRLPNLDDCSRLPYLKATMLEILRLKTILIVQRRTLQDTEVNGFFVPGNTMVFLNLYGMQMDPSEWQQPEQFRPERFLDGSNNVVYQDRIVTFGAGKRSCFGEQLARQEIILFIAGMLQNFDIKPPDGQASVDVHEESSSVLEPSHYKVCMIPRDM